MAAALSQEKGMREENQGETDKTMESKEHRCKNQESVSIYHTLVVNTVLHFCLPTTGKLKKTKKQWVGGWWYRI